MILQLTEVSPRSVRPVTNKRSGFVLGDLVSGSGGTNGTIRFTFELLSFSDTIWLQKRFLRIFNRLKIKIFKDGKIIKSNQEISLQEK